MRKVLSVALVCPMALSPAACGGGNKPMEVLTTAVTGDAMTAATADTTVTDAAAAPGIGAEVANKDKPSVWLNRQPSNDAAGQLDMTALNFNKDTYYAGFDISQGAELQGITVKDYIEKNIDSIGRNGDGIIGYILAIGDIGHNDPIARTKGIRKALGTAVEEDDSINSDLVDTSTNGTATVVQNGSIEVGGETYVVHELASQEMKNPAGTTWDAVTAGNVIGTWSSSLGDQIDAAVSSNDGMDMFMFDAWSKDDKVPTFDHDANGDAVAAIAEGYGGTISQHTDVQAYLTFRVLRNALDEVDIDTDIGTTDDADNALSSDVYVYKVGECSYYALNIAVTAENCIDFTGSTMAYASVSNQLGEASHAMKNVWLNVYNPADNFPGSTCQPLLWKYDKLPSLRVNCIGGSGQTESNTTNRLGNPSQYNTFAISMVKIGNAAPYTPLLEQ